MAPLEFQYHAGAMTTCTGTAAVPFCPYAEKEGFSNAVAMYQTITMQQYYCNFSQEELRLADYDRYRRNKYVEGAIGLIGPVASIKASINKEPCSPEWTSSEIFQLSVKDCATRYSIHKDVLQKAAPMIVTRGFREYVEKHYVFTETDESMIQTLIEWAYTKDYSVPSQPEGQNMLGGKDPLIYHASVYIFADTYLIDRLKQLVITKLRGEVTQALLRLDFKDRFIPLLAFSFGKELREGDELLSWLGRCTLSQINRLRDDPAFQAIFPSMALSILPALKPDKFAMWDLQGAFNDWQSKQNQHLQNEPASKTSA